MKKNCDACGGPDANNGIGGAILCRICYPDVTDEIDRLRAEGKKVNAMGIARRIYRETHNAGNYLLRDIPNDLKASAQHAAIDSKQSLRDWILDAMREKIPSS